MTDCAHCGKEGASFTNKCGKCGYWLCANCSSERCPQPRNICAHKCSQGAYIDKLCGICGYALCEKHETNDCPIICPHCRQRPTSGNRCEKCGAKICVQCSSDNCPSQYPRPLAQYVFLFFWTLFFIRKGGNVFGCIRKVLQQGRLLVVKYILLIIAFELD